MPHLARAASTLLMLAAWLASGPSATADLPAAEEVNLGAVVDKVVKPFLEQKKAVGLVVGVVRDGKTDVFGRGRVAPDSDRVPDGSTLYEIGSISKVFTSLALASMVSEGAVKLDDPVRTLLPGDWKVPRRDDREITLADLSTHTSGLPRVPAAVIFRAIFNDDPYAAFDDRALRQFLSAHTLRRDPGSKFEYSNLGAGLLGYALALKAGGDYEALIASKVTGPLGMTSTRVVPGVALEPRLAKGYKAGGVPASS